MSWIKCDDERPEEGRDILIKIENKFFVSRCYPMVAFYRDIDMIVYYHAGWQYPSHFKKPEYWMYIPEVKS